MTDASTLASDAPTADAVGSDTAPPSTTDTAGKETPREDTSASTDLAPRDLAASDSAVSTPPPYQEQGYIFSRVSLDFLERGYGDWFCAVLPLPNNQLMLVGTTNTEIVLPPPQVELPTNEFTLLRVNGNGKVDTTFGTAGKVHVGMTTHILDGCKAAALTKDGKIVVVGHGYDAKGLGRNNDFVVARFLVDGSLDTGFGEGGMVTTDFHLTPDGSGQNDQAVSLALMDDGRILVGGEMPLNIVSPQSSRALLARYMPDGTLDPTFGGEGMLVVDLATLGAPKNHTLFRVDSLLVESDGSTLAGLTSRSDIGKHAMAVLRLNPDGSVDSSFATDGVLWETRATLHAYQNLVGLSKNADGTLVILGRDPNSLFLSRYFADGKVDPQFGVGGQVITPYDKSGPWQAIVLLRPTDGSFIVGLGASPPSSPMGRFGLVRYTANGVLDEGFGLPSWEWTFEDSPTVAYLNAGALLANDDIILAGAITTKHTWNTNSVAMLVHRTAN